MKLTQNQMEHIQDQMAQGVLTADQANVEMVKTQRVRLIISKVPMSVRKALNAAVKTGELGHMVKTGYKPEAYYHPQFEYLAKQARCEHEHRTRAALIGVLVKNKTF